MTPEELHALVVKAIRGEQTPVAQAWAAISVMHKYGPILACPDHPAATVDDFEVRVYMGDGSYLTLTKKHCSVCSEEVYAVRP